MGHVKELYFIYINYYTNMETKQMITSIYNNLSKESHHKSIRIIRTIFGNS